MDDLDLKILESIQTDSRKSFRDIAKEVESTAATVISRVEKMQDSGVIKGYSAEIDFSKLGYETTALINLQVDGDRGLKSIGEDFGKHPNIIFMAETTGETDVILIVKFKTREELKRLLKDELLKKDYVKKSSTSYIEHLYKEKMGVPINGT